MEAASEILESVQESPLFPPGLGLGLGAGNKQQWV